MQSGSVTINATQDLFNDFKVKMKGMINTLLDEKLEKLMPSSGYLTNSTSGTSSETSSGVDYVHCWGG